MGPFLVNQQQEVTSRERCRESVATLALEVERGMEHGSTLTFPLHAEQRPGIIPGDLVMQLTQNSHPVFRRDGSDLHTTLRLTLQQALLGFNVSLSQLDGRLLWASNSGISYPGQRVLLEGEGMPLHQSASEAGNMLVELQLDMPSAWTPQQRDLLQQVFGGQS